MRILKTNTAVKICVGPLLDVTDGITPELALTVANISAEILHEHDDGSGVVRDAFTPAAAASNNDMVPVALSVMGMYDLEITAANTNFLGRAKFAMIDTDVMLPYFEDWFVVAANVYDSMMGTDLLDTNTAQILNTACHASSEAGTQCVEVIRWGGNDIAATAINGTPKVDIAGYMGTATHAATTAGIIPVDIHQYNGTDAHAAITAGLIPVELHQIGGQAATAAGAVAFLASVGTAATSTAQTGDSYAIVSAADGGIADIHTVVNGIETHVHQTDSRVVGTLLAGNHTAQSGDSYPLVSTEVAEIYAAVITNATGVDIAADIIALKAVADTIQADTDLLDDAVGGLVDIHTDVGTVITNIAALPTAADNKTALEAAGGYLANLYQTIVTLIAQCADAPPVAGTTIHLNEGASAVADYYKGQVIVLCGGTGAGQARACTAYNGATKVATISPAWATDPVSGTWFAIANWGSTVVGSMDAAACDQVKVAVEAAGSHLALIKAKTDSLAFTVAGQVDSNLQYVNDVQLKGDGSATPWGPV